MAKWTIVAGTGTALILDGNRLVGSIAKIKRPGDEWRVEILFAPHDITYEAISYPVAVAFVRGVEKTMAAMLRFVESKKENAARDA